MKLNKNNYFSDKANMEYVSCSQIKAFSECEARAMAELKGEYVREPSDAMLIGSYVDAYLDGEKEFGQFKIDHPEIFTKTGELKAGFKMAEEIIARIEKDKVFRQHLKGRRQVIMTGEICGVPVKVKIDSLFKDKIVDGKVMKDLEDIWDKDEAAYNAWWRYYRYDWQGYIYQTTVFQNTGNKLPFILAPVTKEKGYGISLIKLTEKTIDNAGAEVREKLPRIQALKKGLIQPTRCECCDYCRATKKLEKDIYEEV